MQIKAEYTCNHTSAGNAVKTAFPADILTKRPIFVIYINYK